MFFSRLIHDFWKAIPLRLVVIFLLFTLGIVITGFYYYRHQQKMIFTDQENDLAAIASPKLGQIEQWRKEKEDLQVPLKRLFYLVTIVIVLLIMITAAIIGFSIWKQEVNAVSREIAERKRAEEEIRKLNTDLEQHVIQRTRELEASNKELEAFSYSVAHDLRSPLRSINSYTNILVEEYTNILDDEGKRLCRVISSSAYQMGELIDDLLSFSRIVKCDLNFVIIEMDNLAASVFEDLSSQKQNLKITMKIGKLHKAYADLNLIRIVWNNLISNAIKYSSKKSFPHISIGSEIEDGMVKYWVKDNGVGFEMQYKHKLFGVFQRLHSETEFEGNGVGLAIVKRIITRHNGNVWAEAEVGKGAVFFFSLPGDVKLDELNVK